MFYKLGFACPINPPGAFNFTRGKVEDFLDFLFIHLLVYDTIASLALDENFLDDLVPV